MRVSRWNENRRHAQHQKGRGASRNSLARRITVRRFKSGVSMLSICGAVVLVVAACAPAAAPATGGGQQGESAAQPASQQRLFISVRGEPPTVARKPLVGFSGALNDPLALFNATLSQRDVQGEVVPYLAEALPQVDTDTWLVFPDGRMETTYTLKPSLTWHDGTPLTSEDFVFSWQVYATPELGTSNSPPIGPMEDVVALDPRSFVIHWKQIYADAADLQEDDFPPLPKHLLREKFQEMDPVEFGGLPYWSTEYVGAGPYRLTRWEPGAFVEGEAFDGYVLGRPKIDRIKVLFIPDANTALANLLAGEVHYVGKYVLSSDHAAILEGEWGPTRGGTVLYSPTLLYYSVVQLRPEHADPAALVDVRVRQALAHGFDRAPANEVLNGGRGIVADTFTSPLVPFYKDIERVITKYPYDPRRSQQLMETVGFTKGPDGLFVGRDGTPFAVDMQISSGPKNERQVAALSDSLRAAGFNVNPSIIPSAQHRDAEGRAKAPGLSIRGGGASLSSLQNFTSRLVASQENRWTGQNYGGWVSPAYDQAYIGFSQTPRFTDRVRHITEMNRLLTEELPAIFEWWEPNITAHVGSVIGQGLIATQNPDGSGELTRIHEWAWQP
ncbi:MAG: hypothetical protein GEU73_05690 [Chloroflexi bacterium]|nr:hypothetical protein [Chloroflexota bacterium]